METDAGRLSRLRTEFLDFVEVAGRRAPLYARLSAGIAQAPEVLEILARAPAAHQLPVTMFAAIHDLLLADPSRELAQWYPNLNPAPRGDDPMPVLLEFCQRQRQELIALVQSRVPQTNEVGRSAVLLVGLAQLAVDCGALALLDVGASAGLNLLADHYGYDYDGHRLGSGQIVLNCSVRGPQRAELLPQLIPEVASRLGLDRSPVRLADPEQVRWVEACVWPDQADRFARLRLALAQARRLGIEVMAGDAVGDLPVALSRLEQGHPVVTTSWVMNYLGTAGQRNFDQTMNTAGGQGELSWVLYESPKMTPGLGWPAGLAAESLSVLRLVRWRDGKRSDSYLAKGHPHGYWLTGLSGAVD